MLHGLESRRFGTLQELLEQVDGLATQPIISCDRSRGWTLPPTHWGCDLTLIRNTIARKCREWGLREQLLQHPLLSLPTIGLTAPSVDINNHVTPGGHASTPPSPGATTTTTTGAFTINSGQPNSELPAWQQHLLQQDRNLISEVSKSLLNKMLHEIQPWFHGRLSRSEAEKRMLDSGHKEGKFL